MSELPRSAWSSPYRNADPDHRLSRCLQPGGTPASDRGPRTDSRGRVRIGAAGQIARQETARAGRSAVRSGCRGPAMIIHERRVRARRRTFLGHRGTAGLDPEPRLPYRSTFLPFFSQAPRGSASLRPAARRDSASFQSPCGSWFLPEGHPPRKHPLALGSRLHLAPFGNVP